MNPTTSTPDPAAADSQPAADFLRTQRQSASYIFLGLSVVFLILSIYLAVKAFTPAPPPPDDTTITKNADAPPELDKAGKPKIATPNRTLYIAGWIGSMLKFLLLAGVGIYLVALPQKLGLAAQRTEARVVLLIAGGVFGTIMILLGGTYFYLWSDSLAKTLKGELSEMRWVVGPVLGIAAGAGLVFAAIQPARADERNNSTIRRLVYGANFAVTVLLLFVAVVIGNVVVSLKMPNKLDTTESGFYTLSETTQKFLPTLSDSINFYVIPDSDDRQVSDMRQFVESAQELSNGKLRVEFVSQVSNKAKLLQLLNKYPRIGPGVLLTAGEDEKRHVFIPWRELFDIDPQTGEAKGFGGEGRVMKELRYLADNEQKAIVYFTQGSGEPGLGSDGPKGDLALGGSLSQLKAFLEKSYTEVRPLNFRTQKAVPADADVVIVVEPQNTMPEASVKAIRDYMSASRADKKKGKLIVLAGVFSGPTGKVPKTGLEELLAEYNVQLGDKFIYSNPLAVNDGDYRLANVRFAKAAEDSIIVQTLIKSTSMMRWMMVRETAVITPGNPAYRALPLLLTHPSVETWLEDEPIKEPQKTIGDLLNPKGEAIRQRKQFTDDPRIVAAIVSEAAGGNPHGGGATGTPRLIVVGEGFAFTDEGAKFRGRGTFDLVGVGLDWLRDRPTLPTEAETKKYKEYQTPDSASVDSTRLFWVPLGLALLLVSGLGVGVWVTRRK